MQSVTKLAHKLNARGLLYLIKAYFIENPMALLRDPLSWFITGQLINFQPISTYAFNVMVRILARGENQLDVITLMQVRLSFDLLARCIRLGF